MEMAIDSPRICSGIAYWLFRLASGGRDYRRKRPDRYVAKSVEITPMIMPEIVPIRKERLNHSLKESRCCTLCL